MSASALLAIAGAGAILFGLHRLALWMEDRGWIYYRRKHGSSGSLGSACLEVQAMLEPSKKHVIEIVRMDDFEDDDSAAPPKPSARS
ncbi:MAG TPA: hypothetical protein VGG73_10380 [Vicinamibacterales bacterium]|jgi:hypothetical protein